MYTFLASTPLLSAASHVEARIKNSGEYEWFTYHGRKPVSLSFRNKPVIVNPGQEFGVRKSSNGKNIRLIFPGDENRVITLTLEQARALASGV